MCLYLFTPSGLFIGSALTPQPCILPDQVKGELLWEAGRSTSLSQVQQKEHCLWSQTGLAEKQGSRTSQSVSLGRALKLSALFPQL